jgi:hypothetical protein
MTNADAGVSFLNADVKTYVKRQLIIIERIRFYLLIKKAFKKCLL